MKEPIFLDGRWRPLAQARISPLNSAVLFGESLLEAVPVYGGRPLYWRDHMARLAKGCRFLGWSVPSAVGILRAVRLYRGLPGSATNFILRVGLFQELDFPAAPRDFPRKSPRWFALARPLRHDLSQVDPPSGRVGVAHWRVSPPDTAPAEFKWIFYMMIRKEFRENPTWDEMLRLDREGYVLDGGSSSPLWALDSKILAPPLEEGGLESVTRSHVLRMARGLGLRVVLRRWKPREVTRKGELLFTGSGLGIFRATHLGGKKLAGPGSITRKLWDAYRGSIQGSSQGT